MSDATTDTKVPTKIRKSPTAHYTEKDPFPVSSDAASFHKSTTFVYLANPVPNCKEGFPEWLNAQGVADMSHAAAVRVTVSPTNLDVAAELVEAWSVHCMRVQVQFVVQPFALKVPPEGCFDLDADECVKTVEVCGRKHFTVSEGFIRNVRRMFEDNKLVRIL